MKLRYLAGLMAVAALCAGAQEPLVDLSPGGRLVARYQPAGAPMKPYVKELFSPAGVPVTVDSPPDHFHHHGLMFAIGADGIDFWTEKPFEKYGKQLPRAGATKAEWAGVAQMLDWKGPDGRALLVENRHVIAAAGTDANLITWVTELTAAGDQPAKLWGRHYFGLGMRFPAEMDGKGTFALSSDAQAGRLVRSDEQVRPANWCAAAGEIGGKPVTVAMWDDPANPRRASWFTMSKPFSYLSATLDLEKQPLSVDVGRPLRLRYAVAVFDGAADAARIEKLRAEWLGAGANP